MAEQMDFEIREKLYESHHTQVLRAIRTRDQSRVILKTPVAKYPSPDELSRYRREYEILNSLRDLPGIINVYDLVPSQHSLLLVEEDCGDRPLTQTIKSSEFDAAHYLEIAVKLAHVLGELHQRGIIHKDVNPANILWCKERRELKLIDFSISSLLSQEYHDFQSPGQLEGTYAYLSPEQTGRVNRPLDYRSDLYSFGITLYQMFTGALPFSGDQGIEFVHAHIALQAAPPHEVNDAVPVAVSRIIMKLISKMADDRYQSAWGAKHDLQCCLRQLQETDCIETFELGQQDHSPILRIPQRLYGRESEIDSIIAAFDRVGQGRAELVLVSGYSGTGKSALVHEVHKPLTEKRGLYVAGKFDQYQRGVPFYAWRQAIEEFAFLLLKEDETSIGRWRSKILSGLGNVGKVITDFAPSLELVIGEQPAVPELSGEQALNRFNYAFQAFIKAVSTKDHPLVIFIDDWQWADAASINLLKLLMGETDNHYLMIICAWRDNEVDGAHPFSVVLNEIEQSSAVVSAIKLGNLKPPHVRDFICDALNCPVAVDELVELVYDKTRGNAFFLIQFLKNLYQDSLLHFDSARRRWHWELSEIQSRNITANVVELMAMAIGRLEPATREALQFAACIGNRFELGILSLILKKPACATAGMLESALREGVIRPLGGNYQLASYREDAAGVAYQFIHDQVQQAAYSLIEPQNRTQAHMEIALTILNTLDEHEQYVRIFEIANHVNVAAERFTSDEQKRLLLKLNLQAGKRAKETTAYTPALRYFKTAISHLPEDCWERDRKFVIELYLLAAETAFLTKQYEDMERWLEEILNYADTPLLRASVYEIRLQSYISQNRLNDAVDASLYALRLLGVTLPSRPNSVQVLVNLLKTKWVLRGKSFGDLLNLPKMEDPVRLKVMSLLGVTIPPAYWTSQELVALIVFQMLQESVAHGHSPNTGYAFSWWGITLGGILDNLHAGYEFGDFGVRIAQEHGLNLQRPMFFQGWITRQFIHPIKESIPILFESYSLALEKGDFEYASYALNNYQQAKFHSGAPLPKLLEEMSESHRQLENFKVGSSLYWHNIWWQAALNFHAQADEPTVLEGEGYRESVSLQQHIEVQDASTLFLLYTAKLMLSVFFGEDGRSLKYAQQARNYLKGGAGMYAFVLFHLYESIALLRNLSGVSPLTRHKRLRVVKANLKRLRRWAQHSPANHRHRWHLVMAEYCQSIGRAGRAAQHYERAIDAALNNGFRHDEAFCCECAGRFYTDCGQQRVGSYYYRLALTGYQGWGAEAKANQLAQWAEKHPRTAAMEASITTGNTTVFVSSNSTSDMELDLTTLMKVYRSISSVIVREDLIKTLLDNVIENAGAQKAILVLHKQDGLYVEAMGEAGSDKITLMKSLPVEKAQDHLPVSMLYYVERSQQPLVLDNASQSPGFSQDPYISVHKPLSLLCEPILHQGKLTGILYLENALTQGVFTPQRMELLHLLVAQAAISIENSSLYAELEEKVTERTVELQDALEMQKHLNTELSEKSLKLDEAYAELREVNDQLQHQANTDALTGLANRRYFNKLLAHEYRRSIRGRQPLSVLMSDLDNFKAFNDHYGHLEGDDCLKAIADVFKQVFGRSTDVVARYGGEEIIVVLPDTDAEEAASLAETLRNSVETLRLPHAGNGSFEVVTISIGAVSLIPDITESVDSITQKADKALYQAKEQGRNKVCFYQES